MGMASFCCLLSNWSTSPNGYRSLTKAVVSRLWVRVYKQLCVHLTQPLIYRLSKLISSMHFPPTIQILFAFSFSHLAYFLTFWFPSFFAPYLLFTLLRYSSDSFFTFFIFSFFDSVHFLFATLAFWLFPFTLLSFLSFVFLPSLAFLLLFFSSLSFPVTTM